MMFLLGLWAKFQGWIIAAAAIALAIGAIILKAFLAGKASERAREQSENLKAIRDRKKINDEISSLSDDQLDKRGSRWVRPDRKGR